MDAVGALASRYAHAVYADCPAIFSVGNKKYFQTGMMTIIPNKETFEGLLEHFKEGVRTKLFYGYNARDGEVARSYFGPRFVRLSNYYSTYRNASESLAKIKVFHFRGLLCVCCCGWLEGGLRSGEVAFGPDDPYSSSGLLGLGQLGCQLCQMGAGHKASQSCGEGWGLNRQGHW